MKEKPTRHGVSLNINGNHITTVLIGRHYLLKHGSYMNDALILDLVTILNGHSFPVDSTTERGAFQMKEGKSRLEQLTADQIEEITARAEKSRRVPRVTSQQVNMRLDGETIAHAKKLALAQGIPYTTYLTQLLREDIERLWGVFKKVQL